MRSGFPKINREELAEYETAFPPYDEQRRIAKILDVVDAAIQQVEALLAKFRLMKVGLLRDLLTRGTDQHGRLRSPGDTLRDLRGGPIRQIPRGWTVGTLESMRASDRPFIKTGPFGSSLKGEHWTESGVPVVTIGSLGEGEFTNSELLYISDRKASELSAYMLEEGDLVFSRVADVGRSVVVREAERGWIMSSNLMRISLDRNRVVPAFAHMNLVAAASTREQIRRAVNAGGREVANTAILNSIKFAWPAFEEQQRIVEVADSASAHIRAVESSRDKLKLQKQGLMHDLLTGKVRVAL